MRHLPIFALAVLATACGSKCEDAQLCVRNIGTDTIYYCWGKLSAGCPLIGHPRLEPRMGGALPDYSKQVLDIILKNELSMILEILAPILRVNSQPILC